VTAIVQGAEVLAVGMVTPLGLDGPSSAAAVRGGLSRRQASPVFDRSFEPMTMSLLPEDALPPLAEALAGRAGTTAAHCRMLRLAAPALAQAAAPAAAAAPPPALFLALPEVRPGAPDPVGATFLADLAVQAELPAPLPGTLFRQGGAGALFALSGALQALSAGRAELALVGGVDSFLDLRRLAELDAEQRILGEQVMDGFVPGEAAAVLLLGRPGAGRRLGLPALARVAGVGLGAEKGHRYSSEPYRGDGLDGAFQALFGALPQGLPRVETVYAGFNGEGLPAKEWGVAFLRSSARFAPELQIEHPADCLGDVGAASGAVMLGLAALGLRQGKLRGPCLLWCTSDREPRAAALLGAAG